MKKLQYLWRCSAALFSASGLKRTQYDKKWKTKIDDGHIFFAARPHVIWSFWPPMGQGITMWTPTGQFQNFPFLPNYHPPLLKGDFWFYGPNLFWASFWNWNSLSWSLNGCMVLACYCTTRLPHSRGASSPEDQQPITKGLAFIGDKEFSRWRVSDKF